VPEENQTRPADLIHEPVGDPLRLGPHDCPALVAPQRFARLEDRPVHHTVRTDVQTQRQLSGLLTWLGRHRWLPHHHEPEAPPEFIPRRGEVERWERGRPLAVDEGLDDLPKLLR
jgi:hypothetical protein